MRSPQLNHFDSPHLLRMLLVSLSFGQFVHSLGEEGLDQFEGVVLRFLEWVGIISPVKDHVTSALVTQF